MTFLAAEVRPLVGSLGRVLTDHGAMVNCFLIVVSIVFCYEFDLEAKLTTKNRQVRFLPRQLGGVENHLISIDSSSVEGR